MIWLTWRQFRAAATMMAGALAVLAALLALTGPGLADDYSEGLATCAKQSGGCSQYVQQFFHDYQGAFLAVNFVMLLLPALIGIFWGAPLITRELEAGTHRLVWNQSITRTRWLAVKLGLTGLATMAAAGLGTLAVSWWAGPLDRSAAEDFPRMAPLLFGVRGVVPIGYAAFAFALGVSVGMIAQRTLPAMAITLAVFAVVQVAFPLLVRSHLPAPTRSALEINTSVMEDFLRGPGGTIMVTGKAPHAGDWLLSSHTVDAAGRRVTTIPLSTSSGVCAPPRTPSTSPGDGLSGCLAEIKRLGYRQQVNYVPASRFWTYQWLETALYTTAALALLASCFWWLHRRLV